MSFTLANQNRQRTNRWGIWNLDRRRWLYSHFETRAEADRFMVERLTRGKRDVWSNFCRICYKVCEILPDSSSPMRDAHQKVWDDR